MADVPQLPLKDFFKLFAPTYVLGTTYTVSLAFFEGLIYPEIKRTHLRRCLLLCDKLGFQRATLESSALRAVGREYMAVCAPTRHSFHPKVWLMIGDGKAALLVGSGNLTQSGFMDNCELFDVVELEEKGPHKAVATDVVTFLTGLRSLWSGVDSRRLLAIETLDEMRRHLQHLADRMPNEADSSVRFLSNFSAPLVEQFGEFFVGGELHVAAPYFGGATDGVHLLQSELKPKSIRIFPAVHGGNALDVSLSDLESLSGVSVHSLKIAKKNTFAHLKAYGFDSAGGQWIFTTSANCTLAALGGDNVEAGILRRVDQQTLAQYFAEQPHGTLPSTVRESEFADAGRWFPFWAVDRGSRVELIGGSSDDIPLRNATAAIKVGGITASKQFATMFDEEPIQFLDWDFFPSILDRTKHSALISLTATDVQGREVRGDALIDNPLLLTSDPTHRSAWRAALSLLESEGLPESADLASIFHLVQDVFDADDEQPRKEGDQSTTKVLQAKTMISDKIPIWPPVADQDWHGVTTHSGQLQNLQWFQKILSEFLNPRREVDDAAATTTADFMDAEVAADVKPVAIPPRVVKSIWKQASGSYEQLQTRLTRLVVTKTAARKIWPVAIAVFLATLLTRRQLLKHKDAPTQIPNANELIRSFLRIFFIDRSQPSDFTPPVSCRYRHVIFPSLAEDLHETFGETPSHDIAGILCLLFAYWNVSESRASRHIPPNAWLLFREVAPEVADGSELDRPAVQIAFEKYIFDESEGISWPEVDKSLDSLIMTTWGNHDGYRQLNAIMLRGSGLSYGDGFPEHLEDRWIQTQRRIQHSQPWHFSVDSLSDMCAADGCTGQYVTDPKKRQDLSRFAPTICSSCGAVLIPERLWRAYEENRE